MNFEDQNEENLLKLAKQGDKFAFEILISNNMAILKGYVIKLTCNIDLAEDIIQDTLLSAVINIDSFMPNAKFSTWLIKIATNKYKDYLRKNKETDILEDSMVSSYSLENEVLKNEDVKEVMDILKNMKSDKRTIFILKHYYGYSYQDISKIVGSPVGTVRSRLHYGIKDIISKFKGGR